MWEWVGGRGGEGESRFNRGVCLSDGGGASFLGCVCAPWGALVLMEGGISKKAGGWGTPSHAPPPLTMGNPVNYIYQKSE